MTANGEMSGRTVVVTGASAGIGLETARGLAGMGARLLLVCRDARRGERAVKDLKGDTGNEAIELALADLSEQAQVRALAAELLERAPRIDVLVNNAGLFNLRRRVTADGIEETLAVNHLAPFLLTALLRERLIESAPARAVTVASGAHHGARIEFDDLQGERRYRGWPAYQQSKLANVLFTYELARRLEGTGVTANCLHPGFVRSNFARNNRVLGRVAMLAARPWTISVREGARTPIYLASSPEVEGHTGGYYRDCRPARSSRESRDEEVAARLWEVSERLTGLR